MEPSSAACTTPKTRTNVGIGSLRTSTAPRPDGQCDHAPRERHTTTGRLHVAASNHLSTAGCTTQLQESVLDQASRRAHPAPARDDVAEDYPSLQPARQNERAEVRCGVACAHRYM